MSEKIFYLTKQGLKTLKQEYGKLLDLKKAKVQDEIPQALHSEELDTEFVAYREDMEFLESRIAEIEHILKHVQLISPPKNKKEIQLGAKVKLAVNGQEDEFFIVGTLEADPNLGRISNESPVGKALIGSKEGEEVFINSETKALYKIIKVKY